MRPLEEGWFDVTYPIFEGSVHWPGQSPVRWEVLSDLHCGDSARVSILHLSAHSNTHMDAPSHFESQGIDISRVPLSVLMGAVRVADVTKPDGPIDPQDVLDYEARTRPILAGERDGIPHPQLGAVLAQ